MVRRHLVLNEAPKANSPKIWNDHNVYILGAGFSRAAGLPLISDFMYQMRDCLSADSGKWGAEPSHAISEVLDFRLAASAAAYRIQINLENIEELFSLISAGNSNLDASMRVAIAATIDRAQERVSHCIAHFTSANSPAFAHPSGWTKSLPPNNRWTVPAYEFFVQSLLGPWNGTQPENTFITFNYDQLLERALDGLGVPFSYGVKTLDSDEKTGNLVRVLKLHGSINWAIPEGKRSEVRAFSSFEEVIKQGLAPQLIPPTWRKDSLSAFSSIWTEAIRSLGRATRIVVIGFSIPPTDQHFRYLLAAGLSNNISLREIVFVDPNIEPLSERARSLFANHEHNASRLRLVKADLRSFCNQGHFDGSVHSIGRPLPPDIQGIDVRSVQ